MANKLPQGREADIPGLDAANALQRALYKPKLSSKKLSWLREWERHRSLEISISVKKGLKGAIASGKKLGRPPRIFSTEEVNRKRAEGQSWRIISKEMGIPSTTIRRASKAK